MSDKYKHIPVLLKEAIDLLNLKPAGTYVDCTLGGGGHTEGIKLRSPASKVIGIDTDYEAILATKAKLARFENIEIINDNFRNIAKLVKAPVDGILFDLGVSSYQIDEPSRGFSLQKDGPLDMRMDRSQRLNAKEIINNFNQDKLEKIFREFGEERFAHRIAKAILRKRRSEEISTTFELKKIVEKAIPFWKKRESITRVFQSLRIAVNQELDNLRSALSDAIDLLNPSGRIVAISYHSLEDRIVKHTFRNANQAGKLKILTKKPVLPSASEISSNPRAKSAKLRAAEKI
jgi:16S rRNA (cytosine1402-N4)-methyltransferase